MTRMWIVVGDMTSSGGRVITGSPETYIDGRAVARVGDKATCPAHKGVFPIVVGDPTTLIDGQAVALHGSKLSCGCSVLAIRQVRVFVQSGAQWAANPTTVAERVDSARMGNAPQFDEQFHLVSEEGEPLSGLRYAIRAADGREWKGVTNADGLTQRVFTEQSVGLIVEVLQSDQGGHLS